MSLNLDIIWEDCAIRFVCPRCKNEVSVDSQSGSKPCARCGTVYQLSVSILVQIGTGPVKKMSDYLENLE